MPTAEKNKYLPILIASMALQLCTGVIYIWSVFQPYVVRYFGWASSDVALTSSFMLLAFVSGSLIGGFIQDKTNPRLVITIGCIAFCGGIFFTSLLGRAYPWMIYLTYGAVSGLGVGFVYGSVLSCVQKWLPHKKGLATGLSVGAFGLSVVVFSPVVDFLLNRFDVPVTFRILSIFFLAVTMIACRFFKNPPEGYLTDPISKPESSEKRDYMPLETLRSPLFYCMFFSSFFIVGSYTMFLPLIKTIAVERGMSSSMAIVTVMITGIAMVAAKLVSPILSERIGRAGTILILAVINAAGALRGTVPGDCGLHPAAGVSGISVHRRHIPEPDDAAHHRGGAGRGEQARYRRVFHCMRIRRALRRLARHDHGHVWI
jgi:OFA family oxalate/formate antiporter-like MFS transporter